MEYLWLNKAQEMANGCLQSLINQLLPLEAFLYDVGIRA